MFVLYLCFLKQPRISRLNRISVDRRMETTVSTFIAPGGHEWYFHEQSTCCWTCVALLLSACTAECIPISPSRVSRAIENSVKQPDDLSTLQQGWGMIQVDKAWEYLLARKDCDADDVSVSRVQLQTLSTNQLILNIVYPLRFTSMSLWGMLVAHTFVKQTNIRTLNMCSVGRSLFPKRRCRP